MSQEKTSVIRNNIIGDLKQPKESTRAEQLLFAGTLNYRKGIDTLLRALPPLIASENIHLHVAGDGPMRNDAERFVEKNGLRECVTFHGYVDEIQVLMRRTDLVVVPSRFDSFPNVALEAMRVGTPFIASDIMDVRSAFGPATQYVPVNDPESLAEKLASLQRPDQYSELRDQCMSHRTEFDFDWVGEFESEMTKLLQSTGSEDRL
ncbi:glycosyltransferase involved in cell wall biosynthesis [Salinibacter ruber]|nr:glycosyltransferase involved in cell wall biosynthesis [Salinibacter ruber]